MPESSGNEGAGQVKLKEKTHMARRPKRANLAPESVKKATQDSRHIEQETRKLFEHALALHQKGQLEQAKTIYEQLLAKQPEHFDALHLMGVIALQSSNAALAAELIGRAIEIDPNQAIAYNNLGDALQKLDRLDEALDSFDRAIALNPDQADSFYNRAITLKKLNRSEEALASYDKAIALKPDYVVAFNNRGNALLGLDRLDEALASFERAIAFKPDYAEAFNNRGKALLDLNRLDEALASFERAIALKPDYAEAFNNLGNALLELNRLGEALTSYDKAIVLNPDNANFLYNLGTVLFEFNRLEEALASYDRAIALNPDHAEASINRGNALEKLNRQEEALASFERALALNPDCEFVLGAKLHAQMKLCDWNQLSSQLQQLEAALVEDQRVVLPFALSGLIDRPDLQFRAARIYVEAKHPIHFCEDSSKSALDGKIRIGYFSADFNNHPISYLMAELFESHDTERFEIFGFYFGPDKRDEMRERVSAGFDQFFDVRNHSDREVVQMARDLGIDIAVDLNGFTSGARTGIFAARCAPIQINYLGYPGTMAAPYIDYIVADQTLIPQQSQQYYSEKVVYMPHSYQVNDSKRRISDRVFSRQEAGLPDDGFVFCCFNKSYKILPATFDGWMRLLKAVKGSVLWLKVDSPKAARNLRKEAEIRGVDSSRLVFAQKMVGLPDHLARHRLADLFIDTLPFNAHTTASDALWAGLPVLTVLGNSFAARVAASLLRALDLAELITETQEQYESRAIELAGNPAMLGAIKDKLERNRQSSALFNGQLFARHLEAAYTQMSERQRLGLGPEHIYIDA